MDRFEKAMDQFDRNWRPFGGPSDVDIFVEFGLTRAEYWRRLASARCSERVRRYQA